MLVFRIHDKIRRMFRPRNFPFFGGIWGGGAGRREIPATKIRAPRRAGAMTPPDFAKYSVRRKSRGIRLFRPRAFRLWGRARLECPATRDIMRSKQRMLLGAAIALVAAAATASETIRYTYDARGRLVKVERNGSVNDNVSASYGYDKADNRTNVNVVSPNTKAP
jgi:YD repeat-containing protein